MEVTIVRKVGFLLTYLRDLQPTYFNLLATYLRDYHVHPSGATQFFGDTTIHMDSFMNQSGLNGMSAKAFGAVAADQKPYMGYNTSYPFKSHEKKKLVGELI